MKPDAFKFIKDINDSIDIIDGYLSEIKDFATFSASRMAIDAVERRLAIIGEALWKARKIDDSIVVTDYPKIISLRHILVHDYDLIDKAVLWKIVSDNLPQLKVEIAELLQGS